MSNWYWRHDYRAMPEDVIAFAWSEPMRDLATKFGVSDVALRKMLRKYDVTLPPQGHWNRVHAGREVALPPPPPARRPGQNGRMLIDPKFEPFIPKAAPIPSSGPFASAEVPEDLEELRERETKLLGKVTVPKDLSRYHPAFASIKRSEQRLREKAAESRWYEPEFDNPVSQRQLRLLNALFLALTKRGHDADIYVEQYTRAFRPHVIIGDTKVDLKIGILGKHPTTMRSGVMVPDPSLPASTLLVIRCDETGIPAWEDQKERRLETRVAEIAVSLIVAGEAKFRRQLKESEIRAEEERIRREQREKEEREERERQRLERIRQLNEQRITDLRMSGELLRRSQDLRVLVEEVRRALEQRNDIDPERLAAWESWALEEADKLDPILSGQIMSHLDPPLLPVEGE
ncbi:hypothetical protein [Sphingomonas sp. 37zxx]|uniref:hypothetical protein n=1 Tax=Sphingomonas sp. 37zxx TaxID=1550073 RepID=UPI00053BFBCA|nr:hypothetical protein [Sphingomonas sp. 37zxx]